MAITATNSNRNRNNNPVFREETPYDGCWINIGYLSIDPETGEERFSRLSQGVNAGALTYTRIGKNTTPAFAKSATIANQLTAAIHKICEGLEEGDSQMLNKKLSIQVFKVGPDIAVDSFSGNEIDLLGDESEDKEESPI